MGDVIGMVVKEAVLEALREHQPEATDKRLYSVEQAAQYIEASKSEIYNMIARGELPRVQHGRRTKIDRKDLDAWIDREKRVA